MAGIKNPLLAKAPVEALANDIKPLIYGEKMVATFKKNDDEKMIVLQTIADLEYLKEAVFPDKKSAVDCLDRLCAGYFKAAIDSGRDSPSALFAKNYDIFDVQMRLRNIP